MEAASSHTARGGGGIREMHQAHGLRSTRCVAFVSRSFIPRKTYDTTGRLDFDEAVVVFQASAFVF